MNNVWAVSTSKAKSDLVEIAKQIASELEIKYVERGKMAIPHLMEEAGLTHLLVVQHQRVVVHYGDCKLFFHPGMSLPRIKAMEQGQVDIMVKAMNLTQGKYVLDCTMGLANDAIVMSYSVGEKGGVDGLESSSLIYITTKLGLNRETIKQERIQNAMRRINVRLGDYTEELRKLSSGCYDVVYFDPMFDKPLESSSGIANLRGVANYHKIALSDIDQGLRVARERVVVKHRKNELNYLPFDEIMSGNDSQIAFGIFYK